MRKLITLTIVVISCFGLLFAKPMEALSRYNVVLVHGAAPESQGFEELCGGTVSSAWDFHNTWVLDFTTADGKRKAPKSFGEAAGMLGAYNQGGDTKLTYWLDSTVLEDTVTYGSDYIYIQRSFANPANSSHNNAYELGDRTWNERGKYGKRRALVEEAQEVKAVYDTLRGQAALEIMRQNPDLYRQLASRYILIAHSMGGVVSREYVQGNFYNGDVDKVITLDSPHEGTGALWNLIRGASYDHTHC